MTAWPGRLPEPYVGPAARWRVVEGAAVCEPWLEEEWSATHAHEVHLELESLDLDDEQAIVKFVSTYGVLGMYRGRRERECPPLSHAAARNQVARMRVYEMAPVIPPVDYRGRPNLETGLRLAWDRLFWELVTGNRVQETLGEFRFGAQLVKELVLCWRIVTDTDVVSAIQDQAWPYLDTHPPKSVDDAAGFITTQLGEALREWSPSVWGNWAPEEYLPDGTLAHMPEGLSGPPVSLFQLACCQLFNHIQEGATLRPCHNETCKRWYVRQVGRAEQGQNRTTGTLYHSLRCAQAQAQREARRRKRRKQPDGPEGQDRPSKP